MRAATSVSLMPEKVSDRAETWRGTRRTATPVQQCQTIEAALTHYFIDKSESRRALHAGSERSALESFSLRVIKSAFLSNNDQTIVRA